ncbi:MAG: aminotransferase class I/II-fold pyridoxal phosphate-dependent enzyme [Eubacteriales bacterium]|nr:aminotransferase class I/II-fold pyridoxal phosphate-dependent enzyme [Eubacteriales bacterium]MDD4474657.1 aminotransferase class I/II-fold pyridoxal phosphate-dependent enzyme [Eubacteriales bacterium]
MLINDRLNDYLSKKPVSFHMPGHKGREIGGDYSADFASFSFIRYDVTEIDETLNIYDTTDFNRKLFSETAKLFGADMTLYSCGGATLAIQTALFTAAAGKTVICCKDAHIAVENAFALSSINPVYADKIDTQLLEKHKPAAVFICTEDYYGRINTTRTVEIASICKSYGIPLICDNSHGTHLAFHEGGKLHPLSLGADIVIDSAHKTLPVLTGGAFLHLTGQYAENWRESMSSLKLFATTSPSYLIANSLERAAHFMDSERKALETLLNHCDMVKFVIREKGCCFYDDLNIATDPYRITVLAKNAYEIDGVLKEHNIFSEFLNENHIVLIPSVMNNKTDFEALIKALNNVKFIPLNEKDKILLSRNYNSADNTLIPALSPREAVLSQKKNVSLNDSVGLIAASPVYKYPPAVPMLHIGERIRIEHLKVLSEICDTVTVVDENYPKRD